MKPSTPAAELLEAGWLGPKAAARELGITVEQLEARHRRGDIRRKPVAKGLRVYLYQVTR